MESVAFGFQGRHAGRGAVAPLRVAQVLAARLQSSRVAQADLDGMGRQSPCLAAWVHPGGKTWRLAPHAIQISLRYAAGLQAGSQNLRDTQRRYGTPPGMPPLEPESY
jgi:hypothetical protein